MRLWSGSSMVRLRLNFPLHLHALRTQEDITFASPLHSVHMKNKMRAVTWSFIQSIYQRRFYIFTLFYPSPTHMYIIHIRHIRFCFTLHIFFTALLLFFALLFTFYFFLTFWSIITFSYTEIPCTYTFSRQTNTKNLTLSVLDGWW